MTGEEFVKHLDSAARRLVPSISKILREQAKIGTAEIKARFKPYPGANNISGELNIRSGLLLKSIGSSNVRVNRTKDKFSVEFGVMSEDDRVQTVAGAQEYGATIKPKQRKYLAIPIAHGLNTDGTRKFESLWDAQNSFENVIMPWHRIDGWEVGEGDDLVYGLTASGEWNLIARLSDKEKVKAKNFVGTPGRTAANRTEQAIKENLLEMVFGNGG